MTSPHPAQAKPASLLEIWGGHECTVNRVRDSYRDQTCLTGHQDRIEDLARFAGLGIKTLRYPVLWERVAPDRPDLKDWRWSDKRLAEITRLGMRPIVGLLHHGSGPRYTSLVSDNFAVLFGEYAAAAAERYPWVEDWTPINEPLTTARFSALYGHWYPHAADEPSFWLALLNQIDGIRLAMQAIRRVNPAARLVQTEDLGQAYSTAPMIGLADYYNHRRWMTWDLLAGRVTAEHPLWPRLVELGFGDRIRRINDGPCLPDIIGVNYYITGERFLDHRVDRYTYPTAPEGHHDVTAARVLDPAPSGLDSLLRQAWQRYGLPVAVTESHLGCTREEQLRWLWETWQACVQLQSEGVDIRGLTAWALLGNVDWNSLLTVEAGHYEPGAFDLRGGQPRETAIAKLVRALGSVDHGSLPHPVLSGPGWWRRDIRYEHEPHAWTDARPAAKQQPSCRPILITGATGTLGQALAKACDGRGLTYILTDRTTLAIDNAEQIAAALDQRQPWAVVNAAGWVRVDDAEENAGACMKSNADGAAMLATACAERGIHFTMFSSDLVFDGSKLSGYVESDRPRPLSVYGRSKAEAELRVAQAGGRALIVRTAAFFSPFDPHNFAAHVERSLRGRDPVGAASDYMITPAYVPDLVDACLDLIVDEDTGIWHLTNGTPVTWLEFGRLIATALELDADLVRPATPAQLGWRAERPRAAVLMSTKGRMLPSLNDAISRYARVVDAARAREHRLA